MKRVLVTGGCGFIGSHFVEHLLKNSDTEMVVIDRLNYAARGFDRLRDIEAFDSKRVRIFTHDLATPFPVGIRHEIGAVDVIVHMAAETHVDNSIADPRPFVMANVLGTMELLEYARTLDSLQRFVYFSTDEVFGPAPEGVFYKEWDRYDSTNPYSAAKAGGEELCLAWANTYKLPVAITHGMNVFGERQHPEKFIPGTIRKIQAGETVIVHSNAAKTKAGSRFYIHARNVASAALFVLEQTDSTRDKFNIVGEKEVDNLQMAQLIAQILGRSLKYEMVDFHSSRPGHDLRYALDGGKLAKMGWHLPINFEASLAKMIKWYLKRPEWLTFGGQGAK